MTATRKLRALLDERGIEWRRPPKYSSESKDNETIFKVDGFEWYAYDEGNGYLSLRTCKLLVTPEQAIAATVGDKPKADITGLHATVNAAITGIVRNARCFSDYRTATEHINDNGDVTAIHECVKRAATVGHSCASCLEMDNPDSYIVHLQSALKWHDEHVPRPTNPLASCVVLQGNKPPEEVMFVREGGGVTHYLPENATVGVGTCEWCKDGKTFDKQTVMMTNHGWEKIRHCPNCGRRLEESGR